MRIRTLKVEIIAIIWFLITSPIIPIDSMETPDEKIIVPANSINKNLTGKESRDILRESNVSYRLIEVNGFANLNRKDKSIILDELEALGGSLDICMAFPVFTSTGQPGIQEAANLTIFVQDVCLTSSVNCCSMYGGNAEKCHCFNFVDSWFGGYIEVLGSENQKITINMKKEGV